MGVSELAKGFTGTIPYGESATVEFEAPPGVYHIGGGVCGWACRAILQVEQGRWTPFACFAGNF